MHTNGLSAGNVNHSNIKAKMMRVKICDVWWDNFSLKNLIIAKHNIINLFGEIIDIIPSDILRLSALSIQSNMLSQCTY